MPVFMKKWYSNLRASNKTAATCKDYIYKLRKFLSGINLNLKEIQPSDITQSYTEEYMINAKIKYINGKPTATSDSYRQTLWQCLNCFFTFMVKNDYMVKNPMDNITKTKNNDLNRINENRVLLTSEDFAKIINSVDTGAGSDKAKSFQEHSKNRDKAILMLFMLTGIRKTALCSINVEDINLIENKLVLIDKGNKYQEYYIPDNYIYTLRLYLMDRAKMHPTSNALFLNRYGDRMSGNSIYKLVEKYCEAGIGKGLSPHKLRAGFVSIVYANTKDIEATRRAVGHTNVSTTQRYIVTPNTERKNAANMISSIF